MKSERVFIVMKFIKSYKPKHYDYYLNTVKYHLNNKTYDLERDAIIKSLGWRILRFTNDQISSDWDAVKEKIISNI